MVKAPKKKKRQHFVPRLVFRKFSADGQTISLLILTSDQIVDRASVATQCYKDYFYGADGIIESEFATLEAAFSNSLGDLSVEHLEALSAEDISQVLFFTYLQKCRTLAAAEDMNDFTNDVAKTILNISFRPENRDNDDVSIHFKRPQEEMLLQAAALQPLILDLEVKFLVSKNDFGIILSDNPVVTCNQWAEHHPRFADYFQTEGIAVRGLQWFFPLSPKVCLAIYDPGTYTYGSDRRRTCAIGINDVRLLNTLQALNARECIYFDLRRTPIKELSRLQDERKKCLPKKKREVIMGPTLRRQNGRNAQLVGFFKNPVRVGRRLSCVRVIDQTSYNDWDPKTRRLPVRSPDLIDLQEKWQNRLIEINKEIENHRVTANEAALALFSFMEKERRH